MSKTGTASSLTSLRLRSLTVLTRDRAPSPHSGVGGACTALHGVFVPRKAAARGYPVINARRRFGGHQCQGGWGRIWETMAVRVSVDRDKGEPPPSPTGPSCFPLTGAERTSSAGSDQTPTHTLGQPDNDGGGVAPLCLAQTPAAPPERLNHEPITAQEQPPHPLSQDQGVSIQEDSNSAIKAQTWQEKQSRKAQAFFFYRRNGRQTRAASLFLTRKPAGESQSRITAVR